MAGVPSFFIRTSGCNLRCRWCDTPYASWDPEGRRRSVSSLVEEAVASGVRHVVVTGGEPLLQREIGLLTARLSTEGRHVTIETAGTVHPEFVCDLLSLSPKTANSDPEGNWRERHRALRSDPRAARSLVEWADEVQVKFVVTGRDDLEDIDRWLADLPPIDPMRVCLMPEGRTVEEYRMHAPVVAALCTQRGFRYTPRLHLDLYGGRRGA